ncbi:TetR/AcrR family transcriptional regulator [Mycolicibacterium wolinskyi]|uniref:TetR family transcriptional regulator n=1 Tax=Mycolicibacterium wolinskyi TaxID=59750 RepID=A0A1X2F8G4_9MYCO|nr:MULTISPECIES: TetR/AcrR family transcriptional regulator [Mycolicibacterium]MCV7286577.1 TetR/AcrR family transcriptional regulator [Mycolicibacterium wolinskyi]MCV7293557.1 TetR/AcrR family transcriptional regulator [Mycolicibacterium goodii]ORX14706.1 TetR family transcriptional regulator [Mycolicibacterium wolinskyi]
MATPATNGGRPRRERGSISVDEILRGAFDIAHEVSVDNLSMPQLAKHLDVGVTSIYWYFRRKDDLLDAMTERALTEYDFSVLSIDAGSWRESLRAHAHRMRETFQRNPILCDLILIRGTGSTPAARHALEKIEQPVAALVRAGLTPHQALETYTAISVLVRSSAVLHRLATKSTKTQLPREYWEQVLDPESMPLISSIPGHGYRIGMADDANFDHILDSILDRAQQLSRTDAAVPENS